MFSRPRAQTGKSTDQPCLHVAGPLYPLTPLFSCTSSSLLLNHIYSSLFHTFYSSPEHLLSLVAMPRCLFPASCQCPSPTDSDVLLRLQVVPQLTHSAGCHPEPGTEAPWERKGLYQGTSTCPGVSLLLGVYVRTFDGLMAPVMSPG